MGGDGPAEETVPSSGKMKVFVSYSRADVAFADQLVIGLEDRGFAAILDRHDIDPGEKWRARLGGLILSADAVAFVLTDTSAGSPICAWEVEEAARLGKRIVPVVPRDVSKPAPAVLADRNWIYFYATPVMPESGVLDGMRKLEHALKVDLAWLREQTRLSERAAEWAASGADDRLLRGASLKDAHDWLGRAPKDAHVPASVRDYLTASADAEQGRETAAKAQLAEREEALKTAEAAVKDRARVASRLRWVSVISLVIGVALVAAALAGGWFAAVNSADASAKKAALFAREADALSAKGFHVKALLMALAGDPQAEGGFAERALNPDGYPDVRNALARPYVSNRVDRTFDGHGGQVYSAVFSPDGKSILAGLENGTAVLWRVSDGALLATFKGHAKYVLSVAFAPDGKSVLTGSWDGTAKLWPVSGGEPLLTLVPHLEHPPTKPLKLQIFAVAFSPDGKTILTGASTGEADLWSASDGTFLKAFTVHGGEIKSVAFSADGTKLVTGGEDLTAILWSVADGSILQKFTGHNGAVNSVRFGFGDQAVITGSSDGTAKIWEVATGKALDQVVFGHDKEVLSVAIVAPDDPDDTRETRLLTASADGVVKLWAGGNQGLETFTGHDGAVWAVDVSPDRKEFLTASSDGTVNVWSLQPGEAPAAAEVGPVTAFLPKKASVVTFSPDGKTVLAALPDYTLKLWSVPDGKELATLRGHTKAIEAAAFSPDGKTVLTGSDDKTARLWSVSSGETLATFSGHTSYVGDIAFSPDGKTVLTGSGDGTAILWPVSGGAAQVTLTGHKGAIAAVAFSPDGKRVLTGSTDGAAKLWPTSGGAALATFVNGERSMNSVAFSPDGRMVLTTSYDEVAKLWPASGGEPLQTFDASGWMNQAFRSPRFSPDGGAVLAGEKRWPIAKVVLARADEQVRMACDKLKSIGVLDFSDEDYSRFPILDRKAPHPCAKAWGFDPRTKREAI